MKIFNYFGKMCLADMRNIGNFAGFYQYLFMEYCGSIKKEYRVDNKKDK